MSDAIGMNKENILLKVLRLSPNYYAFLGGVLISASVSLYTNIVLIENSPKSFFVIVAGSILLLVSGICSSKVAWDLESTNRLAIHESPAFMDDKEIWTKLILGKAKMFSVSLIGTVFFAVAGLFIISL